MNTEEIRRKVWTGKVPIEFMNENDKKYYMNVSRISYFPLLLSELSGVYNLTSKTWFSINNIPLPWHLPVGFLVDKYCTELPFKVNVHSEDFPPSLIPFEKTDCEDLYLAMLKESDYLKHGNVKKVMNLAKKHQIALWQSIKDNDFDAFWAVNSLLQSSHPRSVPFRLYIDDKVHQDLFPPFTENGHEATLEDLLKHFGLEQSDYKLQGIKPSLKAPLLGLMDTLSYADNFLHILLK